MVEIAADGALRAGGDAVASNDLQRRVVELLDELAARHPPDASTIGGWGHSGPVVIDGWLDQPHPGDVWIEVDPRAEAGRLLEVMESVWPQKMVILVGNAAAPLPYRFGLDHEGDVPAEEEILVVGLRNLTLELAAGDQYVPVLPDGLYDRAAAATMESSSRPHLVEARPRATVAQLADALDWLAARPEPTVRAMHGNIGVTPALVMPGRPAVEGPLDPRLVSRALRQAMAPCYRDAAQIDPALKGTVTVRFSVGTDGGVAGATVSPLEAELDACLVTALEAVRFDPPPTSASKVQVPVELSAGM